MERMQSSARTVMAGRAAGAKSICIAASNRRRRTCQFVPGPDARAWSARSATAACACSQSLPSASLRAAILDALLPDLRSRRLNEVARRTYEPLKVMTWARQTDTVLAGAVTRRQDDDDPGEQLRPHAQ